MGKSIDPISYIVGGVGSLAGGISSAAAQSAANETNLQIARETNQTSRDIAEANNANQEKLLRQNNAYNTAESQRAWERSVQMFNMENQYNSPIEQLKRYQEAGVNPGVAFGGSLGSASSAAASGNVPAAAAAGSSGVSPSMPSLVSPTVMPVNYATGILDGMEKFANIYKTTAEATKTGKEVKWFDQNARAALENLFKDTKVKESVANINEVQKNWNEFNYALDVMYAGSERNLGVKKLVKEIDKLGIDYYNACLTGEQIKADSLLKQMQAVLTSQEAKNLKDQLPFLIANLQETNKLIKAQQGTEGAKQEQLRASAGESRASAAEHNARTAGIKKENEWIDDEKAAGISESESRTYKNNMDATTPSNYVEVGSKGVNSSKAYNLSRSRWRDIKSDHQIRHSKSKKSSKKRK